MTGEACSCSKSCWTRDRVERRFVVCRERDTATESRDERSRRESDGEQPAGACSVPLRHPYLPLPCPGLAARAYASPWNHEATVSIAPRIAVARRVEEREERDLVFDLLSAVDQLRVLDVLFVDIVVAPAAGLNKVCWVDRGACGRLRAASRALRGSPSKPAHPARPLDRRRRGSSRRRLAGLSRRGSCRTSRGPCRASRGTCSSGLADLGGPGGLPALDIEVLDVVRAVAVAAERHLRQACPRRRVSAATCSVLTPGLRGRRVCAARRSSRTSPGGSSCTRCFGDLAPLLARPPRSGAASCTRSRRGSRCT